MDPYGSPCRCIGQIHHTGGRSGGGIIVTILIGIAGAFVGGFVGSLLGLGDVTGFNLGSIALAIGGALLLLFVYRKVKG